MNRKLLMLPSLALALTMLAQGQTSAPTKVGVVNVQGAMLATKEGQKAAAALQSKFDPRSKELEKRRGDIAALQTQVRNGSNTMSEEQKQKLFQEIDQKTKAMNRYAEDAQAELEQEQNKVLQDLGQKIMAVIDKYSKDNGFALVIDVSNPQTPVLFASNTIDITKEIVELYDKNAPGAPAAAAPAAATPAAKPAAAAAKPAAGAK